MEKEKRELTSQPTGPRARYSAGTGAPFPRFSGQQLPRTHRESLGWVLPAPPFSHG